jgi:hypothetical protein
MVEPVIKSEPLIKIPLSLRRFGRDLARVRTKPLKHWLSREEDTDADDGENRTDNKSAPKTKRFHSAKATLVAIFWASPSNWKSSTD